MDLSKLPRLSNSEKPPAPVPAEPARPAPVSSTALPQSQPHAYPESAALGSAMDAWLSIAIGLILNLITPRIWEFVFSKVFGSQFTWAFTDAAGNPLPYTQSVFFWGDVAFAAFATCMIVDGIILVALRRAAMVGIALVLTIAAAVFNLGYVAHMMQIGYGFQIYSGLAVAFGAYLAMYEWKLLQSLRG